MLLRCINQSKRPYRLAPVFAQSPWPRINGFCNISWHSTRRPALPISVRTSRCVNSCLAARRAVSSRSYCSSREEENCRKKAAIAGFDDGLPEPASSLQPMSPVGGQYTSDEQQNLAQCRSRILPRMRKAFPASLNKLLKTWNSHFTVFRLSTTGSCA